MQIMGFSAIKIDSIEKQIELINVIRNKWMCMTYTSNFLYNSKTS